MQVVFGFTPTSIKVCTVAEKIGFPTTSVGFVRHGRADRDDAHESNVRRATTAILIFMIRFLRFSNLPVKHQR
jgi:hypothetical protein